MGRLCSVCIHRRRREIDAALIEHAVSYRSIALGFGLTEFAVKRHERAHLRERLEEAKMLDAQALAARMAELDGYVDRVLTRGEAAADDRVVLLGVAEARRNADSLMRLIVLRSAEQQQERRTVAANGYPPPEWDNSPETLRTVLKYLIEAGAAVPAPDEDEQPGPEWQREQQQQSDSDADRPPPFTAAQ